jgi:hypothetical protein
MKNSKLINYLQTLSKKEVQTFNEFINSTYHNKSKLIIGLWNYLKPYAPKFEHENLEKSQLIIHLYDSTNQNTTKRFNDLTVTFCKLFERFIAIENLDKNTIYQERLLINAFGERRLSKAFYKRIEKNKKRIEKKVIKDIQDYEQLLFLETERYFYPETSKYNIEDEGMQVVLDTIHDYSKLLKLKNVAEAKQIEMFVNRTFNIEELSNNKNPLFQIYELIIELATNENNNWEDINKLNILFKENLNTIENREEKQGILNFLINYASIHYTADIRYYEVLFENLKLGMESKLLVKKGAISEGHYYNMCVVSCELGKAEWLDIFIKNYSKLLVKNKKDNLLQIAQIYLLFVNQQFNEVILHLNGVSPEKIGNSFWFRMIEIRTLFELHKKGNDYFDLIQNKIQSYRRFCYRQELRKNNIEANFNFIKIIELLLSKTKFNLLEKKELTQFILNNKIVCRLWLATIITKF